MSQITLKGFTDCEHCIYGRDLGGQDYACRSERRRQEKMNGKDIKLVNKKDYTCEYAERKFLK